MKEVFFTPQIPKEPRKGMGWVEIDEDVVKQLRIRPIYKPIVYGGRSSFKGPSGEEFWAYADNPRAYGGRNKRRFIIHSHEQTMLLLAQKKLTIDAVLHFISSWAESNATVITPGKRTISLSKVKADVPGYVYFILNQDNQAIKIGFAKDVRKRLKALQTSSSCQLRLMGAIKTENSLTANTLEVSLHKRFNALRLSGEWFRADLDLMEYIKAELEGTT
jgi:T5orf172 domain